MDKNEMREVIAKRAAKELHDGDGVGERDCVERQLDGDVARGGHRVREGEHGVREQRRELAVLQLRS